MNSLGIFLDNASKVYSPGSQVSGTLRFVLEKELKVDSVVVEAHGMAHTEFEDQLTRTQKCQGETRTRTEYVTYKADINYIDESRLVWTSASGSNHLKPGPYSFPFSFALPAKCGPSFEGEKGYIRYYCKAKIDVPWAFDEKTKTPFTVRPVHDLNEIPGLALPGTAETTEQLGLIFKHGQVNMKVNIQKTGFIPGENVDFTIEVTNSSKRPIEKIELRLVEYSTYVAYYVDQSASLQKKRIATSTVEAVSVAPKTTATIYRQLEIPSVAPTSEDCPLIGIKYEVEAKIQAEAKSNMKNTLKASIPITIGTMPLTTVANKPAESPAAPSAPVGPPDDNEAPQSYAECIPKEATAAEEQTKSEADNKQDKSAPDNEQDKSAAGDKQDKPAPLYPTFNAAPSMYPSLH